MTPQLDSSAGKLIGCAFGDTVAICDNLHWEALRLPPENSSVLERCQPEVYDENYMITKGAWAKERKLSVAIRGTLPGMTRLFAAVLFLAGSCFAQQLTIRVVNSGDGRPLPGWTVDVYFVSQTQGNGAIVGALHHLQTDADGAVQFTLPQSVPDVLTVNAYPQTEKQAEKWYPTMIKGETAVVVQKGIQSKGIRAHGKVKANPGQILVLAKRETLWDRVMFKIFNPIAGD